MITFISDPNQKLKSSFTKTVTYIPRGYYKIVCKSVLPALYKLSKLSPNKRFFNDSIYKTFNNSVYKGVLHGVYKGHL